MNEWSVVAAWGSFTVQIVAASINNLTRHKENEILIYIRTIFRWDNIMNRIKLESKGNKNALVVSVSCM